MKQNSDKKIMQQLRTLINSLTEIRLKENEGTYKTFIRVKVAENLNSANMCYSSKITIWQSNLLRNN
jgi:hypothetical protein